MVFVIRVNLEYHPFAFSTFDKANLYALQYSNTDIYEIKNGNKKLVKRYRSAIPPWKPGQIIRDVYEYIPGVSPEREMRINPPNNRPPSVFMREVIQGMHKRRL